MFESSFGFPAQRAMRSSSQGHRPWGRPNQVSFGPTGQPFFDIPVSRTVGPLGLDLLTAALPGPVALAG